jgi:hypothetical protein
MHRLVSNNWPFYFDPGITPEHLSTIAKLTERYYERLPDFGERSKRYLLSIEMNPNYFITTDKK